MPTIEELRELSSPDGVIAAVLEVAIEGTSPDILGSRIVSVLSQLGWTISRKS